MIEHPRLVTAATSTTSATAPAAHRRPAEAGSTTDADRSASAVVAGAVVDDDGEASPPPRWHRRHARDLVAMVGLLAILSFLWGRGRHVWYWIDEGIAIGIASQPLSRLPELLSMDGSPPLYYAILHVWIALVGTSEAATHLLSLLFALATVPIALWAGWSLFGRRAGWLCAALVALSPYLAQYANETRMYALVTLLVFVAVACFLHAFVFGRRRYLPIFALALALALYSHNWTLFLGLAMGVTTLALALLAEDRRRVLVDGALAFGGVAVLYAPWVPTLAYQSEHSGAPWLLRPTLLLVRDDLVGVLGRPEAVAVLTVGLALGLAVLVPWPWRRPAPPAATAALASAAVVVVTVGVAWLVSRQDSVWTYRYLAVTVAPLVLLFGAGLARGGRAAAAAFAAYALFMVPVGVKGQPDAKSNVRDIAEQAAPLLQPGDLVVASFGRVPVLSHYLPAGLRYAEPLGMVEPGVVSDQRDAVERLSGRTPQEALAAPLDTLPPGAHVLVVCPPTDILRPDDTEFLVVISEGCDDALTLVQGDERFRLDLVVAYRAEVSVSPEVGHLFTKVAP